MFKKSFFIFHFSFFIVASAHAAGTYYDGNYQPPQGYAQGGYQSRGQANYTNSSYSRFTPTGPGAVVGQRQYQQQTQSQQNPQAQATGKSATKSGFYMDGGYSYENAMWQFEMANSGSKLHYDNIAWNVFDINAGYKFAGSTPMQLDAGVKFGFQGTESTMVDDDISNGGYQITEWFESGGSIGEQIGHALSVGTTSGGSMFGFNVGFGLTDFFKVGKMKITPSVGYRHFNYTLKTDNNYGIAIDTMSTGVTYGQDGEAQYDPILILYLYDVNGNKQEQVIFRNQDGRFENDPQYDFIDIGGTYYYQQPGTSHSYDVTWSGPYLGMDMVYEINQNNSVNANIEVGLPSYNAVGDQPYRFDWAHPKSVEDNAGIGSALHLGIGANWMTAITNSISLSIGLTYDYYSVSGADAKTYLSESFYMGIYNDAQAIIDDAGASAGAKAAAASAQDGVVQLHDQCPGWVCDAGNEVDSFYRSLGARIGLNAKF